jgi:peptidylprolyl isomerase
MEHEIHPGARSAAKAGDRVKVHYTCKLEDGSVFATTRNKEAKEFIIGTTSVIPGLQSAVIGMTPGESKTVVIPPDQAYGPYHGEMTAALDRRMIPADVAVEVGVSLRVRHADGHESDVLVTAVDADRVTVDGNHPLAGKNLVMEVELIELAPGE